MRGGDAKIREAQIQEERDGSTKVRVKQETEAQYDEMNAREKQFRPARWFL